MTDLESERQQISTLPNTLNAELEQALIRLQHDLHSELRKSFKEEITKAIRQIEAYVGIQHYFLTGCIPYEMHGWRISPDFALPIIQLLELNDYDLVVEFGSGISTLIVAKTLNKIAGRKTISRPTRQVAFEHLEEYYFETLALLEGENLQRNVGLKHVPIEMIQLRENGAHLFYDCQAELAHLREILNIENPRVLVIVDGPPANIQRHARYPALPIVLEIFDGSRIDLLLDDFSRDGEREIVELWRLGLEAQQRTFDAKVLPLEKGALLISI